MISEKDLQNISTPLKKGITCIGHKMAGGYLIGNIEFEVIFEGNQYYWLNMFSLNLQNVMLQSVFLPLIKTVEEAAFGTSTIKYIAKMMLNFKTVIHTSQ